MPKQQKDRINKKPLGVPVEREEVTTSVARKPLLLPELIEKFRVCWEVWPEHLYIGGEKRQVGFTLELLGTHQSQSKHSGPGCPICKLIFALLHEIAEWILPKERRPSTYEIGSYEQAIRYSPLRNYRPDVLLNIKILHREGFERPVDACEVRCLAEMKQRLTELGARERQWESRKRNSPAMVEK